jgi:hypothetical protein
MEKFKQKDNFEESISTDENFNMKIKLKCKRFTAPCGRLVHFGGSMGVKPGL